MIKKPKKFYITTSLAYTNALPHIGFALELIQADVLARYHRVLGEDVFFLTGTDEHGTKVARKAEESGKNPKDFTDELSNKFKQLAKVLNLSNNDFIRTTDQKRHWPAVQIAWKKFEENGDIYKKKYRGLYCVGCEAFITKKDLVEGKCEIHQKEPEAIEEENYFFKLSKYSEKIKELIKKDEIKIIPEERKNEMLSFVEQGLDDISFSRPRKDLEWGIPVPGDDSQTIYVWADALTNYISALDYPKGKNFEKFWPADIHFLGKDILRFHSIIWPAMLLSLKLPLFKKIFVHGFITSDGQKMSKSLGNVVNPFELIEKYGTDAVRYFLLREISPTQDGDFTHEKFKERYNADLANGVGNLISRVLTLIEKRFDGKILKSLKKEPSLLIEKKENYNKLLVDLKIDQVLKEIMLICSDLDNRIDKEQIYKADSLVLSDALYIFAETIRIWAWLVSPFLPETADKVFERLGLDIKKEKNKKFEEAIKWGGLKPGTKIKKGSPLFPRI
ncbi:MAG: class I tRNA ligase family protein [Candidatus Nealsonbacteria bacterium]|nr:class I tRNA ligase family protein [Candidatus Nealsonbacteria bacterium]